MKFIYAIITCFEINIIYNENIHSLPALIYMQLENSLYTQSAILLQIIDAVDASIYWKDSSGKYVMCNNYMLNMAGVTKDKIIGSTDYLLPWKDQASKIREIDELVINNKKTYKVEERATISSNESKTFLSSKSPLFDNLGKVIGIIGVSIDITQYKLLEDEFQAVEKNVEKYMQIKDKFLKSISYEHRIPLCEVVSAAQRLNDNWAKYDNELKLQTVQTILEESNKLSKLVLDIVEVSKFAQSNIDLQLEKHNLTSVMQETIKNYLATYSRDDIDIIFKTEIDHFLAFDKLQIEKVITNLIMNAERFALKPRRITISLTRAILRNSLSAILCSIQDNGIAVPNEEIYSIFEPFYGTSRFSYNTKASGFGLSLCKEIISAHAGEIWAENRLSEGCSVSFIIPTDLPCISISNKLGEENSSEIITKDLNKIYHNSNKKPFALIGISPFNSYFSIEQILKIIYWIDREFDDFAIFIPDRISKYTLEALGYNKQRIHQKIRKQDNYTENKIKKAISLFLENKQSNKKIDIINISSLIDKENFQSVYRQCIDLFNTSKNFRNGCLETTEWILYNKATNDSIDYFTKNIAVQYLLYELPFMINSPKILGVNSCTFVYHSIPDFLKQLYNSNLVPNSQQYLILKEY